MKEQGSGMCQRGLAPYWPQLSYCLSIQPLRGLEGVPGLPGAPLDEAGLTRKFETSHVGPPPGDLPNLGIESTSLKSPALAGGFFASSATREALSFPHFPSYTRSSSPTSP